jgi:hypothetical protein
MCITKKNDVDFGCTPMVLQIVYCLVTTPNRQEIYLCLKWYVKCEAPTHAKHIVFQSPIYMKALLS